MTLALHPADWGVLAVYLLVLIGAGVWTQIRSRQKSAADYFLAGRHIPVWAVAISTLATAQSAATFVGVPQDAYDGNLTYLSANIGGLLAAFILAAVFIPAYYRQGVATPYELLETRFGRGARLATSGAYLVGRVFASGARIYVGAIPVAIAFAGERTEWALCAAIAAFIFFAILYTFWGGLESVIWTDIVQVAVYLGAAIVMVLLLWKAIPASTPEIIEALRTGGPNGGSKLTFLTIGIDPSKPLYFDPGATFTLLTACTGWTLLMLAAFGTDQDLVQRLLTCRSAAEGSRSVITSTLIGIPVVLVFACIGLLLWVVYNRPDLMGRPTPEYVKGDTADILLKYIRNETTPIGAVGLVIAGVLAAGPAGINASLNSMSGTFINDFYRPLIAPGREERHYVFAGRCGVIATGVLLGAFAVLCIWWQKASGENVLAFVLGVMGFAYAGLLAVFLTALFTRRGTTASAVAGMAVGFTVVLMLQPTIWPWWISIFSPGLAELKIAGPWRLVIGATMATIVCAIPGGRACHERHT